MPIKPNKLELGYDNFTFYHMPIINSPEFLEELNTLTAKYNIILPERIACTGVKRRVSYLSARLCAYYALKEKMIGEISQIYNSPHGEPIWPLPFKGSISHSKNSSLVAITQDKRIYSVGIDIEDKRYIGFPFDYLGAICTDSEINDLLSSLGQDNSYEDIFILIFSIKEAAYKALFPYVKYINFKRIKITDMCADKKTCTIYCTDKLSISRKPYNINVTFWNKEKQVISLCKIEDI